MLGQVPHATFDTPFGFDCVEQFLEGILEREEVLDDLILRD